jgi:hypothetical protein
VRLDQKIRLPDLETSFEHRLDPHFHTGLAFCGVFGWSPPPRITGVIAIELRE